MAGGLEIVVLSLCNSLLLRVIILSSAVDAAAVKKWSKPEHSIQNLLLKSKMHFKLINLECLIDGWHLFNI